MSMDFLYSVHDTHTRTITAIGYHPARRELMIGCEDGVVKTFFNDTGKLVHSYSIHLGWVTDFLYWSELKLVLSSAHDGSIIMWGAGGGLSDKINLGQPVYCMALNLKKQQLICGMHSCLQIYDLDQKKECSHFIYPHPKFVAKEHTDVVKCVTCHESRVYSAGFDQRLIIYESLYDGSLKTLFSNYPAHGAGITCLSVIKDNESQIWIVTGAYDKTVKIWSSDGKLVHRLDTFISNISGLCYVPCCRVMWAAGGTPDAYVYEVKSGDNVSDFMSTFQNRDEYKHPLQLLKFFSEPDQVVGTNSRRHLTVWRYNSSGCLTALKCRSGIDSLAYTKKIPMLIFTGDEEGTLTKWERMQSNSFMYSNDTMTLFETRKAKKRRRKDREKEDAMKEILDEETAVVNSYQGRKSRPKSQYSYNKPAIQWMTKAGGPDTSMLCTVFVEDLDLLIAACENSRVYVWGHDEDAVKALKRMGPKVEKNVGVGKEFDILIRNSTISAKNTTKHRDDSVTNRVAGFVCKFIFTEHQSTVTALTVVGRDDGQNGTYLVSGGWDRRLCIWDLEIGCLQDVFRQRVSMLNREAAEIACDGVILDMAYSPERNEIAYASSDCMVYIRKFSTVGSDMTLTNTLEGHCGEVVCVRWNPVRSSWVTGSEDGTIRIWNQEPTSDCLQVLSAKGSVTALCIDRFNGAIVVGVQQDIRVFDTERYLLVQTNRGHTDAVRSIIHLAERNQYVSTSMDKSIRIWNAWRPPSRKKTPVERLMADDKKRNKSSVKEDTVVKIRAAAAAAVPTIVADSTNLLPTEPSVEIVDGDQTATVPSVPPARSMLRLSAADQAKLVSRVSK